MNAGIEVLCCENGLLEVFFFKSEIRDIGDRGD